MNQRSLRGLKKKKEKKSEEMQHGKPPFNDTMNNEQEPRPGDDGFEGFRRQLPENHVEYMLFLIAGPGQEANPAKRASSLEVMRKEILRLTDRLTGDYIWQRDSFSLEPKREKGLFYLQGSTNYGDCVEDEWLIVYLLRELSKSFNNLWIRVYDGDGEFLLIEAANALPKWLSPENDSNRVWIHDGQLLIIPNQIDDIQPREKSISLMDAIKVIESSPQSLIHSPSTEAEAFYRLEKYPGQITESQHRSLVTIPRKLAFVLHVRPRSIAPATEAFYLRDPIALRPLVSGSNPLIFAPVDLVTLSIRFTKVLFAQLRSQHFDPPPAWASLLETAKAGASDGTNAAQQKLSRLDLGMKVTCGFEILARKAHRSDNRVVREMALLLDDLEEDGESALPTNADIRDWTDVERDDDDSWLDINYDDLERELEGKRRGDNMASTAGDAKAGFGDANAHTNLRKMVSRFETFLQDEQAGVEGAELDDMDQDDDNDDDSSAEDEEDSDDDVNFDEKQFADMMREMMGLPSDEGTPGPGRNKKGQPRSAQSTTPEERRSGAVGSGQEHENQAIEELVSQMESELNEHGALDLDPNPRKLAALQGRSTRSQHDGPSKHGGSAGGLDEAGEEGQSGDDDIDLDYNLAKNLLESFNAQAGMAGPTGNLLSMMGIRLPRDEDQDQSKASKT